MAKQLYLQKTAIWNKSFICISNETPRGYKVFFSLFSTHYIIIFQLLLEIFCTEHTGHHFAAKWILMSMRCFDAKYTEENYATKDSSGMCHLMQQFCLPEWRGGVEDLRTLWQLDAKYIV